MRLKHLLIAAPVLLVLGALAYAQWAPAGLQQVPDIRLQTTAGRTMALRQVASRGPLLVTFWATSCRSCVQEVPRLSQLYRDLHHRGLEILAISMYYDSPFQVTEMMQNRGIPYHVAFDLNQDALRAFRVRHAVTPNTYLIAPDGRVVLHKAGLLDMDKLRERILQMIKTS